MLVAGQPLQRSATARCVRCPVSGNISSRPVPAAEPELDHRRNACPSSITVWVGLAGPRVDPLTGDPFRLLNAG